MVLVRPITLNFTKPIVLLLNMYIALTYGLLHIQFESFPVAFVEIYGFRKGSPSSAIMIGSHATTPPFFAHLHLV